MPELQEMNHLDCIIWIHYALHSRQWMHVNSDMYEALENINGYEKEIEGGHGTQR